MATLDGFILLTATCRSITIQRELTAAFPFRQWLCEHATVLGYTYIAYLDCTLPTPSRLIHFMDPLHIENCRPSELPSNNPMRNSRGRHANFVISNSNAIDALIMLFLELHYTRLTLGSLKSSCDTVALRRDGAAFRHAVCFYAH